MINGVPRILIVRLSAIGDVVRVLPALHALRDRYPGAQIDWAIEPKALDIVSEHPELDQVLLFERPERMKRGLGEFRKFCKLVRGNRYDIAIDFHGILKSGWILRASRAPKRIAFAPPRSQDMSHLFATERVKLISQRLNRIEENLELCKVLGAKRHTLDVTIAVPPEVEDAVDAFYEEAFHGGKRVVVLHVAVTRDDKQWPLERFAALADLLLADGRFEVMLTWGPGQREVAEKVLALTDRNPLFAPQSPDLKHYAALVERADLFFGGDTGPAHIACAMGTRVVVAFGGSDPAKHGPMRRPSAVLGQADGAVFDPKDPAANVARLAAVSAEEAYEACVRVSSTAL